MKEKAHCTPSVSENVLSNPVDAHALPPNSTEGSNRRPRTSLRANAPHGPPDRTGGPGPLHTWAARRRRQLIAAPSLQSRTPEVKAPPGSGTTIVSSPPAHRRRDRSREEGPDPRTPARKSPGPKPREPAQSLEALPTPAGSRLRTARLGTRGELRRGADRPQPALPAWAADRGARAPRAVPRPGRAWPDGRRPLT